MPVNVGQLTRSIDNQIAHGKGDEVGRLGAHGDVKDSAAAKGNLKQKLFNRHELEGKTEVTQRDFANAVVGALRDKYIPENALSQVDRGHLQLSRDGHLLSVTDDKLTHNDAARLLKAATAEPPKPVLMSSQSEASIRDTTEYIRSEQSDPKEYTSRMTAMLKERLGEQKGTEIMARRGDSAHYDRSPEMKAVCRYADIKPPAASLASAHGHTINANYVSLGGKTVGIATQAPTAKTVDAFWNLVEDNNVSTIVDLTNLTDKQKKGIPNYRPDQSCEIGRTETTLIRKEDDIYANAGALRGNGDIFAREDFVMAGVMDDKPLSYLNYDRWPDHGVIPLADLHRTVVAVQDLQRHSDGNLLIHCTAGVGRTGTVFSALALKEMADQGRLTPENVDDAVLQVIAEGRESRGGAFVQTKEQAKLVSDFAYDLVGIAHD